MSKDTAQKMDDLSQLGCSEWSVRSFLAKRANALLERKQALVDLSSFHSETT